MSGIFRWFSDTVVNVVSVTYVSVRNFVFGTPQEPQAPQEPEEPQEPNEDLEITQVRNRRILGNAIAHYEIQNHSNASPTDFLSATRSIVSDFFRDNPNNKFQLTLTFVVVKVNAQGNVVEEEETGQSSKQESVYSTTDVDEVYDRMRDKIVESFAIFLKNGSGWRLKKVVKLTITMSRLNPLRGSSHIPLPKKIGNRKALINMKNDDDKCFKYAVTRVLNPVTRDAERISKDLKKQTIYEESEKVRLRLLSQRFRKRRLPSKTREILFQTRRGQHDPSRTRRQHFEF